MKLCFDAVCIDLYEDIQEHEKHQSILNVYRMFASFFAENCLCRVDFWKNINEVVVIDIFFVQRWNDWLYVRVSEWNHTLYSQMYRIDKQHSSMI